MSMEPCPDCGEYDMDCTCVGLFQQDEIWAHNIDARTPDYGFDEYDEYMMEKWENAQPTDEELKQRMRDEIETLVDLGLD